MTDVFDRAQELEERQRAEALARFAEGREAGNGLSHCEDCGEPIPEARRKVVLGCTRCVQCQEDFEHVQAR